MRPRTVLLRGSLGAALLPLTALAGVACAEEEPLPHPREMELPSVEPDRPDPSEVALELDNGLVAYVIEDRTVPLLTVSAVVGAGTADGPAGAAAALAEAFRRGPADLGPERFRTRLREMVGEYRVEAGPERIELNLDVPEEDGEEALDLLAAVLQRPDIGPGAVAAARRPPGVASGAAAALRSATPGEGRAGPENALALFRAHLFRDHPYGPAHRFGSGALDGASVRAFHRTRVVPGNVVLGVAGALDGTRTGARLESRFGDWEARPPPERESPPALPDSDERAVHLHPSPALQGWVVIGHELPPVSREDRAAVEVMNYILGGGHFDTRLFVETRDRRGLTNTTRAFPEWESEGPGTYTFRTSGRPETVKLLVEIVFGEIERIRTDLVTEEELFVARGALADGVFAERYMDGWAAARSLARERLVDGGNQGSASYRDRIRSVTAEEVRAAARTYLHPDRMTVVIVGPIDEIREAPQLEDERPLGEWGRLVMH